MLIVGLLALPVVAQDNISKMLLEIEANNTTLKALQERASAEKIGNHVGINLENPEIGYSRQWGNSNAEGDKYEMSITQSFDFPTAYRYKKQLAKQLDSQADLAYLEQRAEILFEARQLGVELTYQSIVNRELKERYDDAKALCEAYEKAFSAGEIDIIERNKAKINLINTEKALQMNEVEQNGVRAELQRMNGGVPLVACPTAYDSDMLPSNFEEWLSGIEGNVPLLQLAEYQIESSRKQEQLVKALNLPKLSAGYMNAKEGGGRFNGFSIGVSIPLWENKNTIKHQKAQTNTLAMQYEDTKLQFVNSLRLEYDRAATMSALLNDYRDVLGNTNDKDLLKKALDQGKMSLITYLQELTIYYETVDKYLETQKEYYLSMAELKRWE